MLAVIDTVSDPDAGIAGIGIGQFAVFDHFDDFLLSRALNALFQFRFHKPGFTAMNDIFRPGPERWTA